MTKTIPAIFVLIFAAVALTSSIYGLYIAFSASIALGFIALILEPSPAIIGLLMIAFDYNLPEAILKIVN